MQLGQEQAGALGRACRQGGEPCRLPPSPQGCREGGERGAVEPSGCRRVGALGRPPLASAPPHLAGGAGTLRGGGDEWQPTRALVGQGVHTGAQAASPGRPAARGSPSPPTDRAGGLVGAVLGLRAGLLQEGGRRRGGASRGLARRTAATQHGGWRRRRHCLPAHRACAECLACSIVSPATRGWGGREGAGRVSGLRVGRRAARAPPQPSAQPSARFASTAALHPAE